MVPSLVSDALVSLAHRSLGNKAWTVEYVVRIGAELGVAASLYPNLSSKDRNDLVCQTILKMLDDVEKVEIEQKTGSTETEKTKSHLEECKWVVKNVLPATLDLLGSVKVPSCFPSFPCFSRLRDWFAGCKKIPVLEAVSAVEDALKHPQEYLEEMRDLVSKVERLVSASGKTDLLKELPVFSAEPVASAPVVVAESVPVTVELAAVTVELAPAPVPAPVESAPAPVESAPAPAPESVPAPVESVATSSVLGPAPGKSSSRSLPRSDVAALASSETRSRQETQETHAQLPPSPESPVAQLPGELANLSDIELSQ